LQSEINKCSTMTMKKEIIKKELDHFPDVGKKVGNRKFDIVCEFFAENSIKRVKNN
jgi:hypothetical protein